MSGHPAGPCRAWPRPRVALLAVWFATREGNPGTNKALESLQARRGADARRLN